jgi:benzoyl-CoA reductase/2-hydroxyglutaryl-CoA dehydratase subunit BcrC/BadD/HgdB
MISSKPISMTLIFIKDMVSNYLFLLVLPVLLIPISIDAQESTNQIPIWIKASADWWVQGLITDDEFTDSLKFMIENGAIKIDSVQITQLSENSLTDAERNIYDLEIAQKDSEIKELKGKNTDTGLDNAHLLNSIVAKDKKIIKLEKYKKDHPIKVGNIGGKMINADTIKDLERQIQRLNGVNEELEKEIRELKDQN